MLIPCYDPQNAGRIGCSLLVYVLIPLQVIAGIVTNVINIYVFISSGLPSFERRPLMFLSMAHLLASITCGIAILTGFVMGQLYKTLLCLSAYLVLCIVFDHTMNMHCPENFKALSSSISILIKALVCIVLTLFPHIPLMIDGQYHPQHGIWRENADEFYTQYHLYLWGAHRLFPQFAVLLMAALSVLNTNDYPDCRHATRRIVVISGCFLLSNLPSCIPCKQTYEYNCDWADALGIWIELLFISGTIIIYMMLCDEYKATVKIIIKQMLSKKRKTYFNLSSTNKKGSNIYSSNVALDSKQQEMVETSS